MLPSTRYESYLYFLFLFVCVADGIVVGLLLLLFFLLLLLLLLLPTPPQSFFCGFPFFSFPLRPLIILKTIWRSLPLAWGGNLIPYPSIAVLCFDFCHAAPLLSLDPSRTSHERHVHAFLAVTCTSLSSLSRRDYIISLGLFALMDGIALAVTAKRARKKIRKRGGRFKNSLFVCLFVFHLLFFFFFFKKKKKK